MSTPNLSNLNVTAAAASYTVNGNTAATKVGDSFAAIAAYLAAPGTDQARLNADAAAQKFNELVAAVNAFAS